MTSDQIESDQERAARRLQLAVHYVRCAMQNGGLVPTFVPDRAKDGSGLGDVDYAEMKLVEVTPSLVARHASLLDQIAAGLRDARVLR